MAGLTFGAAANTAERGTRLDREIGRVTDTLSSGLRANKASDDVASMAVGARFNLESESTAAVINDLSLTESRIQVVEGALSGVEEILYRMHSLALQSTNDTYSNLERALFQSEFDKLLQEINRLGADVATKVSLETGSINFSSDFDGATTPPGVTFVSTDDADPVIQNGSSSSRMTAPATARRL